MSLPTISAATRSLLRLSTVFGFVLILFMAVEVSPAHAGTWRYLNSDTTDLSCPVRSSGNVYSSVATCPASPAGKSCSAPCKINTVDQEACQVNTDIYECVADETPESPPPPTSSQCWAYVTTKSTDTPGSLFNQDTCQATAEATYGPAAECDTYKYFGPMSGNQPESNQYCSHWSQSAAKFCQVYRATGTCTEPKPDLIGYAGSAATTIINQAVTLAGAAYNGGTAAAAAFPNIIQVCDSGCSTVNQILGATSVSSLASNAQTAVSATYTPTSAAPQYFRICANTNTGWGNPLTESNTGNNCSGWQNLTVHPTPTATLSLSPASIAYGAATTVSWSSTNATSCTATNFSTGNATSGSVSVTATQNTTYTVYCSGPGGTASAAQTVTVGAQPFPDLTSSIGPTVTAVAGQAATLTGTTNNIGNAATPTAFNDIFLFYAANQSDVISSVRVRTGTLGTGAAVSRSASYAFAAPGTYYYRLCADWDGETAESNEGNNCSGFGTVNVRPASPTGLTQVCNANGTQVTLSWTAPAGGASNYYVRMTGVSNDGYTGTSITYPVTPGQYYDWWVHANIGAADYDWNHYSDAAYSGVTCAGAADLTAGSVSPSSGTVGTPLTLSAASTNNGTGSSGSFPLLFQVSQNGALIQTGYQGGLAAHTSGTNYASYTFNSPGTYQVRACSNFNTSWTAITPETDYSNNCGPWSNITIAAPSVACTVSNANPLVGQTVTYTASGGSSYAWTASDGASGFGSGPTASRSFNVAGTYAMQATSYGSTGYCPAVSVGCSGSPSVSITAAPTRVVQGGTTQLSWSASGINETSCTITGTDGYATTIATNMCVLPSSGAPRTVNTQTKYTITCGATTSSVTVNVIPKIIEF